MHLISITGPTAAGKTAFSLHLAKALGAPVVSADSVQVYRGLNVGSGKITAAEAHGLPHYMLDILDPNEDFSAGEFARQCESLLQKLFLQSPSVLLAGGSGFYFQALWEGFDEMPAVPSEVRIALNAELEVEGLEKLVAELKVVDPATWEVIDRKNKMRVLRALEVYRASGHTISSFRQRKNRDHPWKDIKLGLEIDRALLYERIGKRVDQMVAAGWEEETRTLARLFGLDCKALQALGYREWVSYLKGEYSREEAIELIKRNTRRYAKRQMTWFRRFSDIHWFDFRDHEGMTAYVRERMKD